MKRLLITGFEAFGGEANCLHGMLCDICGTELAKEQLSGGAISAIVTSAISVAGIGGFSLFWFVFKKKRWTELMRFLLG